MKYPTIAEMEDFSKNILGIELTKQQKEFINTISELRKENKRLQILVNKCNCLTMQEYEATLEELEEME